MKSMIGIGLKCALDEYLYDNDDDDDDGNEAAASNPLKTIFGAHGILSRVVYLLYNRAERAPHLSDSIRSPVVFMAVMISLRDEGGMRACGAGSVDSHAAISNNSGCDGGDVGQSFHSHFVRCPSPRCSGEM